MISEILSSLTIIFALIVIFIQGRELGKLRKEIARLKAVIERRKRADKETD